MITTNGKLHIKRQMAGIVPAIALSIAYGLGDKVEQVGDTKLQFEVGRSDVILTSLADLNLPTSRLVFKAQIPDEFLGIINEIAIFSSATDDLAGEFGSKLISTFDSDTETWLDATTSAAGFFSNLFSRIGGDSLRHTPSASSSKTDSMSQLELNFDGYSGNDKFVFAYNVGNANTSQIRFRFLTDSANYYDFSLGSQTSGYKIVEVLKSAAVATGTPSWSNITQIQVTTTSSSGGASQVDYDGIRIEDVDTINPNYVMVARELLPSSFSKPEGQVKEIEFSLDIVV